MHSHSEFKGSSNLCFIKIPFSLSLDLTINRYKQYKPDILIHCGEENSNNEYKTENSLINAVQLGAVLIASNIPPYADKENKEERFVLADSTVNDWYEKLGELIHNIERREKI